MNSAKTKDIKRNLSEEKIPFKSGVAKLIDSQMMGKLTNKKINYNSEKQSYRNINEINTIEVMKKEISSLKRKINEMEKEKVFRNIL